MKILILFGPDIYGGSFVVAEKIADAYRKNHHDVIMVVKDEFSVNKYKEAGYKVVPIDAMQRKISMFSDLVSAWKLARLYKMEKCDLIHSHTSKGGFYSRMCKMMFPSIKVLHTVHGYYRSDNKLKDKGFLLIEKFLLRFGNTTTFVNQEDYNLAKSWHKNKDLHYIPNGVDIEVLNHDRAFNDHVFNIIINARLVWEKGYKEVINLIKELSSHPLHFHIVGSGENETEIKERVKGRENATFYGFIRDIRPVLFKAHLNLLPSYREGLSLSILEAMGTGIPTVAYNIRGNRELIDSDVNGCLCEVGDVACLKKSVWLYFKDRELCKSHGQAAKDKVKTYYSSDANYKKYLEIVGGMYEK